YDMRPSLSFQRPVSGQLGGAATSQLYYAPPWLGKLDKSPELKNVLKHCRKDKNCAGVEFVSESQYAARLGKTGPGYCDRTPDPPECLAVAYPYQLAHGARTLYYSPAAAEVGPSVYAKRGVKLTAKK